MFIFKIILSSTGLHCLFVQAPSVEKEIHLSVPTFFHNSITARCATWPAKSHKTSQREATCLPQPACTGYDMPYPAVFANDSCCLSLVFPYVMSFVIEGDILRNKPSQITSLPSIPSGAEWERTTRSQHKYHLKGWDSQRTEINIST